MPNSMPALRPQRRRSTPSAVRWPTKAVEVSAVLLASRSSFAVTSPSTSRPERPRWSSCAPLRTRQDGAALRRPAKPKLLGATVGWRPVLLASARSGGKNAVVPFNLRLIVQAKIAVPGSHGVLAGHGTRRRVVANPSLKPSPNGVARWPASAGPSAHFAHAVQRATPSVPA